MTQPVRYLGTLPCLLALNVKDALLRGGAPAVNDNI